MKLHITVDDIKNILDEIEIEWNGDIAIFEDKMLKSSYKVKLEQRFPLSQTKTLIVTCPKIYDENKTYLIDVSASQYNFFIGRNNFSYDYQDYLLKNKDGYADLLNSYYKERIADNIDAIEYLYKDIARLKKAKDFSTKIQTVNMLHNIDYLIDKDMQNCIAIQQEKEELLNRYKKINNIEDFNIKEFNIQENKTYIK